MNNLMPFYVHRLETNAYSTVHKNRNASLFLSGCQSKYVGKLLVNIPEGHVLINRLCLHKKGIFVEDCFVDDRVACN